MKNRMQDFYDNQYHTDSKINALLSDYSLASRLNFFQNECISSNDRVMDFGCGSGAILTQLNNLNKSESYGVDVSSRAIDCAKKNFPGYNWLRVMDGDRLPFDDRFFDVIISSEVIEHVFDVDHYLGELHRVLKVGGVLGLSCPFHGFLKDLLILMTGKFEKHFHNPYEPHIRYYSLKGISKVLVNNSFKITKVAAICPYLKFRPLARMMAIKAQAK